MLPDQLLPLLRVPGTDREVRLVVETTADGIPFSGWLVDRGYTAVARLLNFRFRFAWFDVEAETRAARRAGEPMALPPLPTPVEVPLDSPRLGWSGEWSAEGAVQVAAPVAGTRLLLETRAPLVTLHFLAGPQAGVARVKRDGAPAGTLMLDDPTPGVPQALSIANPGDADCTITLEPAPGSGPLRLRAIEEDVGPEAVPQPRCAAPHPGALPAHPGLDAALAGLPAGALALDVGSGPRRLADPRLVALDCRPFEAADVLADTEALPFASASLDLVHSVGEVNRAADPARFVAELRRVLKPGGLLLLGAVPGAGADQLWDPSAAALAALCEGLEGLEIDPVADATARLRALLGPATPLPPAAEQPWQALLAALPDAGALLRSQAWASGRAPG